MFRLQKISVLQFKNHPNTNHIFTKKVIGICGLNGKGKTNLLDAIYYLCFTKSYFGQTDQNLVQIGTQGFRVQGHFSLANQKTSEITVVLRENGKKEFTNDGETYSKMSAHIGKLPAVIIAPDDIALITGPSENRRKLLDGLLCQLNNIYLKNLIAYNKTLQQRNSLLKQMAEQNDTNNAVLPILDEQLAQYGYAIAIARHQHLAKFIPIATKHYQQIAGEAELVHIAYKSCLTETEIKAGIQTYLNLLKDSLSKDLVLQRTTAGIHRDDLIFTLNQNPFKQVASQGQRKSLLFALKLTEFENLQEQKGFAPLLLLDDVFEKLDSQRMKNLLQEVCTQKDGQVFITDTHLSRLQEQLTAINADFEIVHL